jgi:subtilisin family serine protease
MDALFGIETSSFVTGTLGLNVQSDVGVDANAKTFEGSWDTAFEGESYAFDSYTAYDPFHDKVEPAGSAAATQGVYPDDTPPSYRYYSGTSMAAPHATGVAALLASQSPSLLSNSQELKKVIMDKGKPVSTTAGKTVTGDMVDALATALSSDSTAPTVTAPKHSLLTKTTSQLRLGSSTSSPPNYVPGKLEWSGQDASGIAKYELQQSTSGGAFANLPLSSSTDTTKVVNLEPSKSYRFQVRATDTKGNVSTFAVGASFTPSVNQESSSRIVDSGTWTTASLTNSSGGSVQYASTAGRLATYSVPAGSKNVAWVTTLSPSRGKAAVTLIENGARKTPVTVDAYLASSLTRSVIFAQALDPSKTYKVEVKVLGTKSSASTSTRIDVDAFVSTS